MTVPATVAGEAEASAAERRETLLDACILALVVFVASATAVSLLISAYHRNTGAFGWAELGNVGNFWAGHFNSLALIVLALTLQIQRRQFREQQRQFREQQQQTLEGIETQKQEQRVLCEQVVAVQMDLKQQSLHFVLEQLRALSERLPFRVVRFNDNYESDNGPIRVGLDELSTALQTTMDGDNGAEGEVIMDPASLRQYIEIGRIARKAASAMEQPAAEMCEGICKAFLPDWLEEYFQRAERLQAFTDEFSQNAGLNRTTMDEWMKHVRMGWRIERHDARLKGHQWLTLRRDALHAPQRLVIRNPLDATPQDLLLEALRRVSE